MHLYGDKNGHQYVETEHGRPLELAGEARVVIMKAQLRLRLPPAPH